MGMINKVGDTLSTVSKDVFDKVKSNNDATRLKQQIVYEQEKIDESYVALGKSLYSKSAHVKTDEDNKTCADIDARLSRIARLSVQINDLKGIKVCPHCGVTITNNFLFCGICGTKLPEVVADTTSETTSLTENTPLATTSALG